MACLAYLLLQQVRSPGQDRPKPCCREGSEPVQRQGVRRLDTAGLDTAPAAATDGTVQRLKSTEIGGLGRYKYLLARFRYLGCGKLHGRSPLAADLAHAESCLTVCRPGT